MPKLAEPNLCTGCTACAAVCPKACIIMEKDSDGFFHPMVNDIQCIDCGRCEKVCPVMNPVSLNHTPTAWAAWSSDENSRIKSTSGGVFPELAQDVLDQGGAVFGAAYNEGFEVEHICVEDEAELDRLRGAKYAQSDLNGAFTEVKGRLDSGQRVLFSGTPCQVLGLKCYLKKDYSNLLTVDLVCHSVPSPLAWKRYLEYISGEKTLTAVNLRCKDTGWSRYSYSNRFNFSDGTCRMDQSGESLYMKLFGGGYITRRACTNCPAKGYSRISDLTLGDFWGIWNIAPELDDNRGTSLVLVQTEKGRSAMERLNKRAVTLEAASRENPAIVRAAPANPLREQIMELIRYGDIDTVRQQMPIAIPQKRAGFPRRVLGLLKRRLLGK